MRHIFTNIIEEAIRKHKHQIQLFASENDVNNAIKHVMRENPDIFWFSYEWRYSETENILYLDYTFDSEHVEKIKTQINDVIEQDFKISYARSLLAARQVMYVYKWIALYCNYNIYSAHNQTIYSVFVHRNSVCTGIAKAAQYLLGLLGIDSKLVFGRMNNSPEGSRHCWLVVKIEGEWYHLDPTFAIPETADILSVSGVQTIKGVDSLFYNYFCVDTETIKQSRTIEDEESYPTCISAIDYNEYQTLDVTPSRNGKNGGLGCLLSDSGTTADIYLVHDKDIHYRRRSIAKVFRNDDDHELFRKELVVMRECAGPYILHATDADFDNGVLYIGQATPLSELLSSHYFKMTIQDLCFLLIDIASGLKELLNCDILYRDIHLNNIYLSDTQIDGRYIYKLGDFGSCVFMNDDERHTLLANKGGIGSKWYMAPETWNEGIFDERSAVYGVGMIAYFLLNDLYPPLWLKYGDDAFNHRMQLPQLPKPSFLNKNRHINLGFDFIGKALTKDILQRQQTIDELVKDIIDFLSNTTISKKRMLIDHTLFNTSNFCSTCALDPQIIVSNGWYNPSNIDDFATTSCPHFYSEEQKGNICKSNETFWPQRQYKVPEPVVQSPRSSTPNSNKSSIWDKLSSLFSNKKSEINQSMDSYPRPEIQISERINSSIFAPSEAKRGDYIMVQVFLYKNGEEQAVACKAAEVDSEAERKNYTPLSVKLRKGDKVKVSMQVSNKDVQVEETVQELIWQGHFIDCQFAVYVSEQFSASILLGTVVLSVNGAPVGRMMFKTNVVDNPRKLYAKIDCKSYHKIFISYSHKDESRVKYFAEAYKAQGVDYFFDRHYLKAGDVYPVKIQQYIDSADLFILCWSKNAAESEYVTLERNQAMLHAYPQVSIDKASIAIHPISIEPRAAYPQDMNSLYNFEEV